MSAAMKKEIVLTSQAPQPIGPYSQAVKVGGFVFCSGQIALDASTGQVVAGDVKEQSKKVMENLRAVLQEAGSDLNRVVKSTIFLKSMGDFPTVNEVYGGYFTEAPPARSTVEVSRLPKDVLVEIEVIALQ